jgi:uncharacterized damage-inducible protein DinB
MTAPETADRSGSRIRARSRLKRSAIVLLLLLAGHARGEVPSAPTLKSILLAQLKTTHNQQDWFVPCIKALDGLTPEQAMWKEGDSNHSIAQLTSHLTFWNARQLARFTGAAAAPYSGNNEETFTPIVDAAGWAAAIRKLDDVLTAWEKAIERADDAKLQAWYSTIAHISTHNAYHTGQILYIRKQQGSWDPAKGVK